MNTWYVRGIYVQQYTWYPGIIRRMIFIVQLVLYIRVRQTYVVPGSWYDKQCLRELSNQVIAGTLLHVQF